MLLNAMNKNYVEVPLSSEVVYDIVIQTISGSGSNEPLEIESATDVTIYMLPATDEDLFDQSDTVRALRFTDQEGEVNEVLLAHAPAAIVVCATGRSITAQRQRNRRNVERGAADEEKALAQS